MKEYTKRFLLWSQKYTRVDMLYIMNGSLWTISGQAVSGILSLVLIIAFANLLPKETYGVYRYILSVASMLNIFTLTGMGTAISRITAQGEEILKPMVLYQLKWNMFMFIAFVILGGYYFTQNDLVLGMSFFILGFFIPASIAFNTYGSYLEGKKEFKSLNLYRTLSTLVYTLGTLLILLLGGEVVALITIYALTTFGTALFFYRYALRSFPQTPSIDASATIMYARELTYIKFIDPIASQIDKIILAHFWGPAQLATYSLALAVPDKLSLFMKNWVSIGFPKFATKTPEMINTVFYRRIFQGIVIGSLITITYVLLVPYLFTYMLPQYIDSIFYSQLFALNFIFALPNRYMSLLFASQKLSKLLLRRTLIVSTIFILLYILFGVWGGLLGLICANILNTIIGFFVNIIMWHNVSKIKLLVV